MSFSIASCIRKDGQLDVPPSVLDTKKVKTDRRKRQIINQVSNAIATGQLTFARSFLSPISWQDAQKAFTKLLTLSTPDLLNSRKCSCQVRNTYDLEHVVMLVATRRNLHYNKVSSLFQRLERCKVEINGHSQFSLWRDPHRVRLWLYKLGKLMGNVRSQPLNSYLLRKAMSRFPYATQFSPFVAKGVYVYLKANRVLDPCFGWGDRFAAAYCTPGVTHFHGIDPREGAQTGYQAQLGRYRTWAPKRKISTVFTRGKAEEVDLRGRDYDTVFTSPPFFERENYKDLKEYPNISAWFEGFLEPMITNAWAALQPGGHLALHMQDDRKRPICNHMNAYIQTMPRADYKGIICVPQTLRPGIKDRADSNEPIWVWLKRR